jgi:hypothetical protein
MREAFTLALGIVERSLLSIVAIFAAMIMIGIASHGGGTGAPPRTMTFHPVSPDSAVESTP